MVTQTMDDLIAHSQRPHTGMTHSGSRRDILPLSLNLTRAEKAAQFGVCSIVSSHMAEGKYGSMETMKPDNTIRIMLKKKSSLQLFASGHAKGKKIQQINKLIREYGCDGGV